MTLTMTLAALLIGGAPDELPKPDQVKPVLLFEVPHYCEGVVFDREGRGYISAGPAIYQFELDGKHCAWAETGAPNGHKILADGTHLVCDAGAQAVLRLSADAKPLEPAAKQCNGQALRGPNDLTLDATHGGFYFTDPGGSSVEKPIGTVHYVDASGHCVELDGGLAFPNGIALRPDGRTLLVAESQRNRVLEYTLSAPGVKAARRVFAELPAKDEALGQTDHQPDGMCLDAEGRLYVAHYGMRQVQVLGADGKLLARYDGGNLTTSNVAFGGPQRDQLFVTGGLAAEGGRGGLFRLELGVQGLEILPKGKGGP